MQSEILKKIEYYATTTRGVHDDDKLVIEAPAALGLNRTHNVPNYRIALPVEIWPAWQFRDGVIIALALLITLPIGFLVIGAWQTLLTGHKEFNAVLVAFSVMFSGLMIYVALAPLDYLLLRLRQFLSRSPVLIMTSQGLADPQTGQLALRWGDVELATYRGVTLRTAAVYPKGLVGRCMLMSRVQYLVTGRCSLRWGGLRIGTVRAIQPDSNDTIVRKAMMVLVAAHGGQYFGHEASASEFTYWRGPEVSDGGS